MATYRIGIGSFNLKDGAVGIGTESSGLGNLKVEGTYKVTDLDVTGVSTFTRYAGFTPDNLEIGKDSRDRTLTGEHQTTGDIVVGVNSTFTVSVGSTVEVGTVPSVSIGTHFSPPTGGVEERPEVPVEGTVRFNKDLNTLEFYNGVDWRQFTVSGQSGRAVIAHGKTSPAPYPNYYDVITIPTTGSATYFGDFAYGLVRDKVGCGSRTRGLFGGGTGHPDSSRRKDIDYVTIAANGNAIDFGDLNSAMVHSGSCSSETRGIWSGGYGPSSSYATNLIDYVEIATVGNGIDFGDLAIEVSYNAMFSSPIHGFSVAGYDNQTSLVKDDVQMLTIASKGNAIEFGSLTAARSRPCALANSVMGFSIGGSNTSDHSIDRTILASGGNAVVFGDSDSMRHDGAGTNTHTRGVFSGGTAGTGSPGRTDSQEYFSLQTGGTTQDFGNLTVPSGFVNGTSDSHGGLGGY
jgi:hypothetical protein